MCSSEGNENPLLLILDIFGILVFAMDKDFVNRGRLISSFFNFSKDGFVQI